MKSKKFTPFFILFPPRPLFVTPSFLMRETVFLVFYPVLRQEEYREILPSLGSKNRVKTACVHVIERKDFFFMKHITQSTRRKGVRMGLLAQIFRRKKELVNLSIHDIFGVNLCNTAECKKESVIKNNAHVIFYTGFGTVLSVPFLENTFLIST